MNFGFMIPGMISGWIYQHVGYEMFFLIALFMAIPVFLLTIRLPFTHRQDLKSAETK